MMIIEGGVRFLFRFYAQLRERRDLFQDVIAQRRCMLTVTRVPVPDEMFGEVATGNLFSLLAAKPLYGRTLEPRDDSVSAPSVILLSYRGWQQLLASDPDVVGKIAEVDGRATAVIGVMPEDFVMPGRAAELWLPLRLTAADIADEHAQWVETLARLKKGLALKGAQTALDAAAAALNRDRQPKQEKVRLRIAVWQAEAETVLPETSCYGWRL